MQMITQCMGPRHPAEHPLLQQQLSRLLVAVAGSIVERGVLVGVHGVHVGARLQQRLLRGRQGNSTLGCT